MMKVDIGRAVKAFTQTVDRVKEKTTKVCNAGRKWVSECRYLPKDKQEAAAVTLKIAGAALAYYGITKKGGALLKLVMTAVGHDLFQTGRNLPKTEVGKDDNALWRHAAGNDRLAKNTLVFSQMQTVAQWAYKNFGSAE